MEPGTRAMRIGAAIPHAATKGDPDAARDFAQAAEQLGYAHLEVYDHVLGASPAAYPAYPAPTGSSTPSGNRSSSSATSPARRGRSSW